jgi:twitching motility two-component system response regulator PilH
MAKILIVDDSPAETTKLREILQRNKHQTFEAVDGEHGVSCALEVMPDLILMDVVMPGMNGFQATRKLSRTEQTKDIPVVIVSTKDQETDRVWGKRQGAKDYLTKPVDEHELLRIIDQLIS